MAFYDDLKYCEGATDAPSAACTILFPIVEQSYPRMAPWEELQVQFSCPPGEEPDPPQLVVDRGKLAMLPMGQLEGQNLDGFEDYVEERYGHAYKLWQQRVEFCASSGGEEPGGVVDNGDNGGAAVPAIEPAKAGFPMGWGFLIAGLALIAAGRRR